METVRDNPLFLEKRDSNKGVSPIKKSLFQSVEDELETNEQRDLEEVGGVILEGGEAILEDPLPSLSPKKSEFKAGKKRGKTGVSTNISFQKGGEKKKKII